MVESVCPSFSRAPFNQYPGQVAVVQNAIQLAHENVVPSQEEEHDATTGVDTTHVLNSFTLCSTPSDIRTMLVSYGCSKLMLVLNMHAFELVTRCTFVSNA